MPLGICSVVRVQILLTVDQAEINISVLVDMATVILLVEHDALVPNVPPLLLVTFLEITSLVTSKHDKVHEEIVY